MKLYILYKLNRNYDVCQPGSYVIEPAVVGVYDALEKCEARMNRASLDYRVDLVILNEAGVVNQYNYYKKM